MEAHVPYPMRSQIALESSRTTVWHSPIPRTFDLFENCAAVNFLSFRQNLIPDDRTLTNNNSSNGEEKSQQHEAREIPDASAMHW